MLLVEQVVQCFASLVILFDILIEVIILDWDSYVRLDARFLKPSIQSVLIDAPLYHFLVGLERQNCRDSAILDHLGNVNLVERVTSKDNVVVSSGLLNLIEEETIKESPVSLFDNAVHNLDHVFALEVWRR